MDGEHLVIAPPIHVTPAGSSSENWTFARLAVYAKRGGDSALIRGVTLLVKDGGLRNAPRFSISPCVWSLTTSYPQLLSKYYDLIYRRCFTLPWLSSPHLQFLQLTVPNAHSSKHSQFPQSRPALHIETGREALAAALWLLLSPSLSSMDVYY